jgi:hypothetical protein
MARITRRKYDEMVKAAAMKIKPGQIIGYRVGGEAAHESEHFYSVRNAVKASTNVTWVKYSTTSCPITSHSRSRRLGPRRHNTHQK